MYTRPKSPLWASRLRRGRKTSAALTEEKLLSAHSIRSRGMPMPATMSRPVRRPPSPRKCPALGREKVTVTSARTASPRMRPVSASTPLAMSAETTGISQVFIICTAVGAGPRRPLLRPMPKRASTITSASRHQRANSGSSAEKGSSRPPAFSSRRSISRQSAVIFSRLPTRTARTWKPASSSRRAAATPSPPLLPAPQKHTARRVPSERLPPDAASSMAASATARAACSIKRVDGIPRSWMAARSISRICCAVAIFMLLPHSAARGGIT